jgi:hypothetical protein
MRRAADERASVALGARLLAEFVLERNLERNDDAPGVALPFWERIAQLTE